MEKFDKSGTLPEVAAKLGIGSYHRHVFLCAGDRKLGLRHGGLKRS